MGNYFKGVQMSELKAVYATDKDSVTGLYYPKSEADEVIAEKDDVIAELKVKLKVQTSNAEKAWKLKDSYLTNYAEAVKELYDKNKEIAELKESHKKEVEQLLMEILGLKKLVETADKIIKPKGGFTVKDIAFNGVKLEGLKGEHDA